MSERTCMYARFLSMTLSGILPILIIKKREGEAKHATCNNKRSQVGSESVESDAIQWYVAVANEIFVEDSFFFRRHIPFGFLIPFAPSHHFTYSICFYMPNYMPRCGYASVLLLLWLN